MARAYLPSLGFLHRLHRLHRLHLSPFHRVICHLPISNRPHSISPLSRSRPRSVDALRPADDPSRHGCRRAAFFPGSPTARTPKRGSSLSPFLHGPGRARWPPRALSSCTLLATLHMRLRVSLFGNIEFYLPFSSGDWRGVWLG